MGSAPATYCSIQMVDYMRTSMSMRVNWPLKPEDQKTFEGAPPVVPPLLSRRHVHASGSMT